MPSRPSRPNKPTPTPRPPQNPAGDGGVITSYPSKINLFESYEREIHSDPERSLEIQIDPKIPETIDEQSRLTRSNAESFEVRFYNRNGRSCSWRGFLTLFEYFWENRHLLQLGIGGVGVLVEDVENVIFMPCQQYLLERYDQDLVMLLLRSITVVMRADETSVLDEAVDGNFVKLTCTTSFEPGHPTMILESRGGGRPDFYVREQIENILAFLIGVFHLQRFTMQTGVYISGVITGDMVREFLLDTWRFESECCWKQLFDAKAVYTGGRSTPGRLPICNKMLRSSFEWIAQASGADTPVDVGGGLCLVGVYSILIPIKILPNRALLWHHLMVQKSPAPTPRSRRALMEMFKQWMSNAENNGDWYKTDNLEDLRMPQHHLLGWTKVAEKTVGTRGQNYRVRRSRAAAAKEITGVNINTGLSLGYGGNSLNLGATLILGTGERSIDRDKYLDIVEWLQSSEKELILLYNPEELQAWIVPEVDLVLHMTIAVCKTKLDSGHLPPDSDWESLYMTSPEVPGDANNKTPCEILSNIVCRAKSELGDFPKAITDIILSIMHTLGNMSPSGFKAAFGRAVQGYEAYDLVHQPRHFNLKGADISKGFLNLGDVAGWHKLIPEMSAVIFFVGIDDPILPSNSDPDRRSRKHSLYSYLPRDENYLAITASSLKTLLGRYNDKKKFDGMLAQGGYWHCEYLFDKKLADDIKDWNQCDRLSHIISQPTNTQIARSRRLLEKYPNGALIFRPDTGLRQRWKRCMGYGDEDADAPRNCA